MQIFRTLFEIVIGLALVGVVATSTNSGSTALAGFTSAQTLVILVPLIFVAIILYAAYSKLEHGRVSKAYHFVVTLSVRISKIAARGFSRIQSLAFSRQALSRR